MSRRLVLTKGNMIELAKISSLAIHYKNTRNEGMLGLEFLVFCKS